VSNLSYSCKHRRIYMLNETRCTWSCICRDISMICTRDEIRTSRLSIYRVSTLVNRLVYLILSRVCAFDGDQFSAKTLRLWKFDFLIIASAPYHPSHFVINFHHQRDWSHSPWSYRISRYSLVYTNFFRNHFSRAF